MISQIKSFFSPLSQQKILERELRNAKLDLIEYQDNVNYYNHAVKYIKVKIAKTTLQLLESTRTAEK